MEIQVCGYSSGDIEAMNRIWNEVVEEGAAFPQMDKLTNQTGMLFFGQQSFCGVAKDTKTGEMLGLYILHPNNEGRCGHICNASYAVASRCRGQGVGERLVVHCLEKAAELGFRIMQFNAVVRTNEGARHLYEKLGFVPLGCIPGGFLKKDGQYEDIIPYYRELGKEQIWKYKD